MASGIYYNKTPIYPIFYLLRRNIRITGLVTILTTGKTILPGSGSIVGLKFVLQLVTKCHESLSKTLRCQASQPINHPTLNPKTPTARSLD